MKTWRIGLALVALVCAVFVYVTAEAETQTGTCGLTPKDHVIWSLEDDGTLTISGEGNMEWYQSRWDMSTREYRTSAPWGADVRQVVIEPGVTSIGNFTFSGCTNLTSIHIPGSQASPLDAVQHSRRVSHTISPERVVALEPLQSLAAVINFSRNKQPAQL